MRPTLRFTTRALRDLKRLDAPTRLRVLGRIKRTIEDPPVRAVRLKGLGDTMRIRVGDWRVLFVYESSGNVVEIQRVVHRSDAYRQFRQDGRDDVRPGWQATVREAVPVELPGASVKTAPETRPSLP